MNRCVKIFVGVALVASGMVARADTDSEVSARKDALEIAGAFANDGFKIRDGHWCGVVKPRDHALVAVNLYAGNQYWFSVGANEPVEKIAVSVYDEAGNKVATESYDNGNKAAAGFSPDTSGQYFVSVDLVEGKEGNFCLVYSYK